MFRVTTLLLLAILAAPSRGQQSDPPDPLFRSAETLQVTLRAPLTTLIAERPTDEYLSGSIEYLETDGQPAALDVKLRARGHLRNEICDVPPIRLNFKKSHTKETLFEKQDKLKLVVHCNDSIRYEQALIREYLAYRLLNAITPLSFQVRLLRITYIDNEEQRDQQSRYAFLMEHKNRLGKRIDRKDLKIEKTSVAALQPEHLNLTSVFQFLIGNTDFSPIARSPYDECCHNYDLFSSDSDLLIGIPYDFDQSGFVNAPYAAPSAQFPIKNVRQRLYRGRCVNNDYVESSLQRFREKRDTIYEILANQEGLTPTTRKSLVRYVDEFYAVIDDPDRVERYMIRKCI